MFPLRDSIPSRYPPVMTWLLIGVNVVVFVFELSLPSRQLQEFIYLFGIVPARYTHPGWARLVGFPLDNYWPFLTSMFLHGGWLHIIGNMWMLWLFGDNVEDRMGPGRFLVFYLLCGVLAGVAHLALNPGSRVPTIGASGAIAGVLGAYFVLYPLAQVIVMVPILFFPFFFTLPAAVFLALWFFMQFLSGTVSLHGAAAGGVAWWAHVGGFVAGAVLYRLFLNPERRPGGYLPSFNKYRQVWGRKF